VFVVKYIGCTKYVKYVYFDDGIVICHKHKKYTFKNADNGNHFIPNDVPDNPIKWWMEILLECL
jgi:hypothetical protein